MIKELGLPKGWRQIQRFQDSFSGPLFERSHEVRQIASLRPNWRAKEMNMVGHDQELTNPPTMTRFRMRELIQQKFKHLLTVQDPPAASRASGDEIDLGRSPNLTQAFQMLVLIHDKKENGVWDLPNWEASRQCRRVKNRDRYRLSDAVAGIGEHGAREPLRIRGRFSAKPQTGGLTEATYNRRMAGGVVAGIGDPRAREPLKGVDDSARSPQPGGLTEATYSRRLRWKRPYWGCSGAVMAPSGT